MLALASDGERPPHPKERPDAQDGVREGSRLRPGWFIEHEARDRPVAADTEAAGTTVDYSVSLDGVHSKTLL
jgi:hypothetical protein